MSAIKRSRNNEEIDDKENMKDSWSSCENLHLLLKLNSTVSKKRATESIDTIINELSVMNIDEIDNWIKLEPKEASNMVDYASIGSLSSSIDHSFTLNVSSINRDNIHMYSLNEDGPLIQSVSADDSSEATAGSTIWQLPCIEFENIWPSLWYDDNIKNELLSYLISLIDLSERGIDSSIISVNRLMLLLGPPGTGKTSLCKALAQIASIILSKKFARSAMLEVNSHSLFSKWFSESGKLVGRLFEQAEDIASDEGTLLFLLIDEAESLCASRSRSSNGNDPTDSVRAVNALLTQLDKLRRRKNVFVLCTSNLGDSLDGALVDRADISRLVPLPGINALTHIYRTCLDQLIKIGVIIPPSIDILNSYCSILATHSLSLSSRAIRQLPAVAYARSFKKSINIDEFVELLKIVIDERKVKLTSHV